MDPKNKKIDGILKKVSPSPQNSKIGVPKNIVISIPKRSTSKTIFWGFLSLAFVCGIFYASKILELKKTAADSRQIIQGKTIELKNALESLDLQKATGALKDVTGALQKVMNKSDSAGLTAFLDILKKVAPQVGYLTSSARDFYAFLGAALNAGEHFDALQKDGFRLALDNKGADLLSIIDAIIFDFKTLETLEARLKNDTVELGINLPEDYLAMLVNLRRAKSFTESLYNYLSAPTQNIAILFQNPSEIRPGGGFIGSYAEIALRSASVSKIDVRDIYDPDGQLSVKILPPQPLQTITGRWGARDANWFFDFPTSAEKVLSFLDKSKIYMEEETKFSGALAINVKVIEDILGVIGPVVLPEYNLKIDPKNFLTSVQKEVESGEDKKQGEPKKILKVLTPVLIKRLAALTQNEKRQITQILKSRIAKKDIMAYSRDRALEVYLQNERLGGEIYGGPGANYNDYLAFVSANIAGGKSDAFIEEAVNLKSFIDIQGKIFNQLEVIRKHNGAGRKEWWYRAPNKTFFEILSPERTKLLTLFGHDGRIPDPPIYRPTYERDNDVATIEKSTAWIPHAKALSFNQFGKTTFAGWATIKAGETGKITAEYENPNGITVVDGENYRFVYERQSGVIAKFSYSVEAPPGFIWKESGATTYTFQSDDPDGRVILDLTLQKI